MTVLVTAFQRGAFQFTAFQEAPVGPLGGAGDFIRAVAEAERLARIDREKRKHEQRVEQEVKHVVAQAAPIVTDLSVLDTAPPRTTLTLATRDRELEAFHDFLMALADAEEFA